MGLTITSPTSNCLPMPPAVPVVMTSLGCTSRTIWRHTSMFGSCGPSCDMCESDLKITTDLSPMVVVQAQTLCLQRRATLAHLPGDLREVVRVGLVVVAGILAGGEHAAQRVTFIDGPRHHQHVCTRQRAVAAAAGRAPGLGRQSRGPLNIGVARQAGRRTESQELQAGGRLGIEIDDLALKVLRRRRLGGTWGSEGRLGRWGRDWIEAEISLDPLAVDSHAGLRLPEGTRSSPPTAIVLREMALFNYRLICQRN